MVNIARLTCPSRCEVGWVRQPPSGSSLPTRNRIFSLCRLGDITIVRFFDAACHGNELLGVDFARLSCLDPRKVPPSAIKGHFPRSDLSRREAGLYSAFQNDCNDSSPSNQLRRWELRRLRRGGESKSVKALQDRVPEREYTRLQRVLFKTGVRLSPAANERMHVAALPTTTNAEKYVFPLRVRVTPMVQPAERMEPRGRLSSR
jgi:hypothetical protein